MGISNWIPQSIQRGYPHEDVITDLPLQVFWPPEGQNSPNPGNFDLGQEIYHIRIVKDKAVEILIAIFEGRLLPHVYSFVANHRNPNVSTLFRSQYSK